MHKRRVHTTYSQHHPPVAPNLLQQDFTADAPNQKRVGDIVGIWTDEGWLYLAALLDTFSRRVVGWAMGAHRDEALVENALQIVLAGRALPSEVKIIHQTDRGSQYTTDDYLALLASAHMQVA